MKLTKNFRKAGWNDFFILSLKLNIICIYQVIIMILLGFKNVEIKRLRYFQMFNL